MLDAEIAFQHYEYGCFLLRMLEIDMVAATSALKVDSTQHKTFNSVCIV